MSVLADTNVALRETQSRCRLHGIFSQWQSWDRSGNAAARTLLDRRILQNRPNKKLSETALQVAIQPVTFTFFYGRLFFILFI